MLVLLWLERKHRLECWNVLPADLVPADLMADVPVRGLSQGRRPPGWTVAEDVGMVGGGVMARAILPGSMAGDWWPNHALEEVQMAVERGGDPYAPSWEEVFPAEVRRRTGELDLRGKTAREHREGRLGKE